MALCRHRLHLSCSVYGIAPLSGIQPVTPATRQLVPAQGHWCLWYRTDFDRRPLHCAPGSACQRPNMTTNPALAQYSLQGRMRSRHCSASPLLEPTSQSLGLATFFETAHRLRIPAKLSNWRRGILPACEVDLPTKQDGPCRSIRSLTPLPLAPRTGGTSPACSFYIL